MVRKKGEEPEAERKEQTMNEGSTRNCVDGLRIVSLTAKSPEKGMERKSDTK